VRIVSATNTSHGGRTTTRALMRISSFGFELVEQLHVARGRIDEVFEDAAHDRATPFVREQEHLDDPMGGHHTATAYDAFGSHSDAADGE
jgi:hypothetical protein